MTEGIKYKLYLGFNNQTLDLFSSLCQLEEAEMFEDGKPKRCLQASSPKAVNDKALPSQFEYESPDIKVLSSYGKSEVVVRGSTAIANLKSAVVMVHIYQADKGIISFAYPPVDFQDDFNFDSKLAATKYKHIAGWFLGLTVFFIVMTWGILKASKAQNQRNLEEEVATNGISMQELPSHASTVETEEETIESQFDQEEKEELWNK